MEIQGKVYGYARVSSRDQNLDRQLIALRAFPVPEEGIVTDKSSGKNFCRPGYEELLEKISAGDLLVIKSVDRLGRNYDEIQSQWRYITRDIGANVVVLDMPLLDTRADVEGITGVFLADIVLQVLSYVAQIERDETRRRQAEGIAAAVGRGVKFGRPSKPIPDEFEGCFRLWQEGAITLSEGAQRLEVSRQTFAKWCRSRSADL